MANVCAFYLQKKMQYEVKIYMKKLTLLLIYFVSVLNISAYVFSGSCGTNVKYSLDTSTGVLKITGTGAMADYSSSTSTSAPWYSNRTYIKSVEIADGVTSIGDYAFVECSALTSIIIPNSVTAIGNNAFYFTGWYDNQPDGIVYAGKVAYKYKGTMPANTNITLKEGTLGIADEAFSNCSSITSVTIPNSVTEIGERAFHDIQLKSLIVGSGVLSFGNQAITTTPIKTIWLPNTPPQNYKVAQGTVNYVANSQYGLMNYKKEYKFLSSMFEVNGIRYVPVSPSERTCDAIDCVYDETAENITIGESVTNKGISLKIQNIQPYLCYNNTYIKKVNIESGYKGSIPSYSFYECTSIISAIINNQGSIEEKAFYRSATNSSAIFLINNSGYIGANAFNSCSGITSVTISNQGNIGQYAFYGCKNITSATINNQGNIGQYAFYGSATSNYATFTIKNNGDIGTNAFNGCTKITQLTIDNNGSIGESCFSGCTSLRTATLGNNIPNIGASAFQNCSNLGSIVIPDAVQTLGKKSFYGCSSMTSIKIGDAIKLINDSTFFSCSSLKNIEIGDSVNSIYASAFNGCKTLPEIRIPQNVTVIGNNVFSGCTGLKTVIMADSEKEEELKLGYNGSNPLFADCPLDSVYIGRNISYSTSSSYGYSPFYRNTSLRSVTITDKETEISENEFYGCTNLQNVKIGDGVTFIGNWAFSGCSSLKNFSFGTQVKTIGKEAFSDCTAVTAITSKAQTPPTCGSQALDDINKWECTLYVPEGRVADYQTANQWKEFFFVEEGDIPVFIRGDVNDDGVVNGTDIQVIINFIVAGEYDEKGDVNEDGTVNGTDIQSIINFIVGDQYDENDEIDDNIIVDDDEDLYDSFIFEDSTYGGARNNCTPKAESGWELWLAGERRTPDTDFNYNGTRIFNNLGLEGLKVGYYCNGQWPNGYMIYGNASLEGAPSLTLPADRLEFTYHAANWKVNEAREIHFEILDSEGHSLVDKVTYTSSDKNMDGNRSTSYEADKFTFKWDCPKEGKYKIKLGSPAGETFIGNISIARRSSCEP
jgi:hypothetical protein